MARGTIVTVGGEYERQRERGSSLSESEFGPFPGASGERRSNRAAYAQFIGALARINVQAGARIEDNERFGTHATYRGGLSVRLTNALRMRTSAGTGFKEPRFYEQFATGFVRGNPDLEPETSRSIEAGADLTYHAARFSATWFAQRFRNLIQYIGMPSPQDAPNYFNLAAACANGLELEGEHTRGHFGVRATYTMLDTDVTDPGTGDDPLFAAGQMLIRRPSHSASLLLSYSKAGWMSSVTASYVGGRDDLDFNGFPASRVRLDAYTRVDLAAEAPLRTAGLRATLKVENVLDSSYEEASNFPARGRIVFVGVRYGY
jgi:vitamin B12 transporter